MGVNLSVGEYVNYVNVPRSIGVIISRKMATLHELDTVLGSRDAQDLLEILAVDSHNEQIANQKQGGDL